MAAPVVGAIGSYAAWGFYSRLGLIWGTAYWQFNKVDDNSNQDLLLDSFTLATAALATSFVLYPASTNVAVGWAVKNTVIQLAKSPVAVGVTAAIVAGAIVSDRIDPVSGYDNYVGFISGGNLGESNINYWSGDANNSGYFNVPKNISIISQAGLLSSAEANLKARYENQKARFYNSQANPLNWGF